MYITFKRGTIIMASLSSRDHGENNKINEQKQNSPGLVQTNIIGYLKFSF